MTRPAGPAGLDRLARVVVRQSGQPGQPGRLGTLLTVWAHPDDETYLAGGLMAAASAAGWRVVCVTATSGELAGDRRVRSVELARALALLGVGEHLLLDYPDGGCDQVDAERASARIAEVVAAVRPDVLVTFGPDGFTGHRDHQAVSAWVGQALAAGVGEPPCLLHATCSADRAAEFGELNERLGVIMPGAEPPRRPADEIALAVRLSGGALDLKTAALRAHRSQTAGLIAELGAELYAAWVAVEEFAEAPVTLPTAVPSTTAASTSRAVG